jgi:hypothetical protein
MSVTAQQGNVEVAVMNPAVFIGSIAPVLPLLAVIVFVDIHAAIAAHQPFAIAAQFFATRVLVQDFPVDVLYAHEHAGFLQ